MRNKIYSEKRRKLYRFVNQVLKNSFITKLIHKDTKDQSIEIDALTGVYNQFGINQFVKELHPQETTHYGILLINIDNLDEIRTQYNQKSGDKVIYEVAQKLAHNIRETDLIGRLSDSEFILILNDINQAQMTQIAGRLLNAIQAHPIKLKNKEILPMLSYGISVSDHQSKSQDVLQQADHNRFMMKDQSNPFYAESQTLS
ncbi:MULTISPECIES: GGDEF domain-containing protein [Acinetobacter]|uniref:GGDEF domain-containing protein n=1 Tax=Acinetobacter TaxID=469 RepID=UPI00101FB101|nr:MULTISPECIES: GGDEF domain-containing protein [Acinetobacter]MDM1757553.1 diguanylate cyclase [Acinetobacter sp. 256-1]MDM1761277.1 diguanylate cyclase [Acinetobacter sp. 251-1]RYL27687.1 GGDEF domain-containing protein [Acinetobacter piscicola]